MFGKKAYRNDVRLSKAKVKELAERLERARSLGADLPERLLGYVLDGADEAALGTLAAAADAAQTLGMRCAGHVYLRNGSPWEPFFQDIGTVDTIFYLRLAKVFEAAARQLPPNRFHCAPHFDGAAWLELLLQEAAQISPNVWSSEKTQAQITGAMIEEMLRVDGHDPLAFLTAPFRTADPWEGHVVRNYVQSVPDLGELYARHRGVVAPRLVEGSAQARLQALEMIAQSNAPAECFTEELVAAATGSSKQLREASEILLRGVAEQARPLLERVAAEGDRNEREQAVRMLSRVCGPDVRAFLEERAAEEKSVPVQQAIEAVLRDVQSFEDTPSLDVLERPERQPIALAVPVSPTLREALSALFGEYNTYAEEHNQQLAHPPAKHVYIHHRENLSPLGPKDLDRICKLLAEGGDVLGALGETMAHYPGLNGRAGLRSILEHPDLALIHAVRLLAMLNRIAKPAEHHSGLLWGASSSLDVYRNAHQPPCTLVDVAEAIRSLGLPDEIIAKEAMDSYWQPFDWEPEAVWPYMADKIEVFEQTLEPSTGDAVSRYCWRWSFDGAMRLLATFPQVPPTLVGRLWEMAIGPNKADRLRAQKIVVKLPDRDERLAQALTSGNYQTRLVAAEWMGRLGNPRAAALLHAAAKKEKQDAALEEMLTALEKLGEPIEPYLDRERLAAEATKKLAKGIPPALDWFPWSGLPTVHWQDTGKQVPPEVITWLIVQNYKLKSAEAGPLLRRYAQKFAPAEREELGRFVLLAWLEQDLKRKHTDTEARAVAQQQAAQSWQACQTHALSYTSQGLPVPAYLQQSQQQLEDSIFANLQRECGTAASEKGVLAVAGACCGESAVAPVQKYLKDWYGYRAAQCKALIAMLSTVESPAAIQYLLSIANRFRTKSVREEADKYVHILAERKGWTLDELANRTMPTAGFEDDGTLTLSFGSRAFTARVNPQLEIVLADADGKVLKNLPAPRKDDDEEQAKAAKKAFSAAKSELKRFAALQATRLYEAMATERTWPLDDWRRYVLGHPLARFLCQRLVWAAVVDGKTVQTFRPLDDGTLTDVHDEEVHLADDATVRIAHTSQLSIEDSAAWTEHLADYSVSPLFTQFGREPYELPQAKRRETSVRDFEGHMVEAFKLRGTATKLGFARGPTEDGGWFYNYVKKFPGLELEVHLNFSGNGLPEENRPVALTVLTFQKSGPAEGRGPAGGSSLPLEKIPAVLLSECYNDMRSLAALGTGHDPDWEKNVGW